MSAAEERYRQLLVRHLGYAEPPLTAEERRELNAYESGAIARMIGGDREL